VGAVAGVDGPGTVVLGAGLEVLAARSSGDALAAGELGATLLGAAPAGADAVVEVRGAADGVRGGAVVAGAGS